MPLQCCQCPGYDNAAKQRHHTSDLLLFESPGLTTSCGASIRIGRRRNQPAGIRAMPIRTTTGSCGVQRLVFFLAGFRCAGCRSIPPPGSGGTSCSTCCLQQGGLGHVCGTRTTRQPRVHHIEKRHTCATRSTRLPCTREIPPSWLEPVREPKRTRLKSGRHDMNVMDTHGRLEKQICAMTGLTRGTSWQRMAIEGR